jgi:hypothetical protein
MQLRQDMRNAAEGFARQLARVGVDLSFDREGVVALDGYVESNRALWSAEDRERLSHAIGAFVGECMVETYGLAWRGQTDAPALGLPAGGVVTPVSTVLPLLGPQGGASLSTYFDEVGAWIAAGG